MNIIEAIKTRILKFLGLEKLTYNPDSERFTFINDPQRIIRSNLQAYKIWYVGDSDELLNYYTDEQLFGNMSDPIYNRNKRQYFWGLSAVEANIKRVHSGVPNAIISTLSNVIGVPKISSGLSEYDELIEKIKEDNDFDIKLNQEQLPMTMVEGWGAYKININEFSTTPIIQFYEAENVEFVYKSNMLIGIIYKDYYEYGNKNYVLLETRRIAKEGSIIEYELFRLNRDNDVTPVEMDAIPDLADLKDIVIPNYNKILGVPCKFFYDPLNKNYGRSLFAGKIDLFDDLDQILSQDSQTVRVSTPVEYYPVDLLERGKNGRPEMPKVYNRQYVKKEGTPDGDGHFDNDIQTTQPQLNFEQYSANARAKLDFILTGILSPATMGIEVAKKDNAEAQREKEKVTIMTRNNIIKCQTKIVKLLFEICLDLMEYKKTGFITPNQDYQINVQFNEFANPSFENEIEILGGAWSNGEMSTEKYVELLWGDKLSKEDKKKEIAWLDNNREKDNMPFGDIEDVQSIRTDLSNEEEDNI